MKMFSLGLAAAAFVLAACGPADGYGRGGYVREGSVSAAGPRGSANVSAASGAAAGPYGGVRAGEASSASYTSPRGTTVQSGQASGYRDGPYGARAGSVDATRVTTPNGRTYTDVDRAGVAAGPGGVRYGESGRSTYSGPYGAGGSAYRGGVAVGPGGVAVGGGAVHSTAYYSPTAMRTTGVAVRGYSYSAFTPTWYGAHANVWVASRWVGGVNVWVRPAWPAVATFVGLAAAATPIVYDYGSTTVINNNTVYQNGDPVASAPEYAAQAMTIADAGRQAKPPETDDWQPLGVFGMIQGDETVAQRIFQLAVNKAGILRGNYYDAVADNNLPVYGSVDPKSQRAAWTIGDKKDIVFEAGLTNLTQNETTVLIHYGKDRTSEQMLVRLDPPKQK